MATIYFVTEQFLKTNGIITPNVDAGKITPLIQFAAKSYVKSLIGTLFFNDLLDKYNAQTLSVDEETLVAKMQFAICFRACAQAVITLSYTLANKGIQKQSDDNSTFADLAEVKYMYENYIHQAKLYEDEMTQYLKDNKDLYPVYLSVDNKDSIIKRSCGGDFPDVESTGVVFL